jgi:hypothetical protein
MYISHDDEHGDVHVCREMWRRVWGETNSCVRVYTVLYKLGNSDWSLCAHRKVRSVTGEKIVPWVNQERGCRSIIKWVGRIGAFCSMVVIVNVTQLSQSKSH